MPSPKNDHETSSAQSGYARKLELFEPLRRSLLLEALAWLELPKGSLGLDAGCGVGLHLQPLLQAVSPAGRVVGVDLSPELLNRARALIKEKDLADSVDLQQADMMDLPFEPASFDWIWSVDCAGYMPGDKTALMGELTRLLKPGGRLALMAYSSQQLLPGHPGLEARLNATKAGQAPFNPTNAPGEHFMRLPEHLSLAGLFDIKAKSFMAQFSAPLEPGVKESLYELMDMRWSEARDEVSQEDWSLFLRLSQPASKECILETTGYHGFFTYTMFTAIKPD